MAILKHIASKNTDYGEAERYLIFQHDEYTQKPILDENGHMLIREEYYLDGINCDSFTFAAECQETNAYFHKNQSYNEIKSHHYIISFDPKDRDEHGLTGELAQQLGVEYAKENFPGHQALVCTHTDGHNGSGNIHVHIVINSIRKYDTEPQPYMEFDRDSKAGYKHHLSDRYRIYLKQKVMDMCTANGLNQVDLLTPAERKISEKEYWAKRRGQKNLDKHNTELEKKGLTPRQTTFQTEKQYLRDAIDTVASQAISQEDFSRLLSEKYNITFKVSRGRYSYLHPDRQKKITERALGTRYGKEHLEQTFLHKDPIAILYVRSHLRLVVDLQTNVKAMQSPAYARRVKLTNLQQMANTIIYVQEHGIDTQTDLKKLLLNSQKALAECQNQLAQLAAERKTLNSQIHYTGQYFANKDVYSQFLKSRNKGRFRKEHATEIQAYEEARDWLKSFYPDGKMTGMKTLKSQKEKLQHQIDSEKELVKTMREKLKTLETADYNVDKILQMQIPETEKAKTNNYER